MPYGEGGQRRYQHHFTRKPENKEVREFQPLELPLLAGRDQGKPPPVWSEGGESQMSAVLGRHAAESAEWTQK